MAGVEKFNDRFLGNAPVPMVGTMAGSTDRGALADTRVTATGYPAIATFDPTANMRNQMKAMTAAPNSPSATGKTFTPSTVDSFNDGVGRK